MDGLPGLEKVFKDEFRNAKILRCQLHVTCNVLAKVPTRIKKMWLMTYARSSTSHWKRKLKSILSFLKDKWEKELFSVVECLERSIENCLTFFGIPKEEWVWLRKKKIIEQLNKEFKLRTKLMEIVAGMHAYYTLFAFISLKIELHRKKFSVRRIANNLPVLQNLK